MSEKMVEVARFGDAVEAELAKNRLEADEEEADEEEIEPLSSVVYTAEDFVTRAWRAAVLGLLVCPPVLHCYSLYLLLRAGLLPDELSPAGKWRAYAAFAIDTAILTL